MSRLKVEGVSSKRPVKRPKKAGGGVSAPPVGLVLDVLEDMWHQEANPGVSQFDEPLDGLILTILSQNTNDRNRDAAFENLRKLHGSWENISALSKEEVAFAIRSAGISNNKARAILNTLEEVRRKFGGYSLVALRGWSPAEAWEFLVNLPGVGPKTAACVMVFDLGFAAFPVDTHIARFCRRMDWAGPKESPVSIQERMEVLVPDGRKHGAHLNIITHGKNVCMARSPKCEECELAGICPYFNNEVL